MRLAGLFAFSLLAIGCTRDTAEEVCPDVVAGDLVVTEIGGPQSNNELLNEFVEIYNASGAPVDLLGIKIRFRRRDGSSEVQVLVRRSLIAAPGSYTVLGKDDDLERESYIDYGFVSDFSETWLAAAAVDVEACGTRIDRASYDSLPRIGTYSLGSMPPTEEANDLPANWCTDVQINLGSFPGTPQEANAACP
ncbi:MAG: lamin tail domain-containing protein [Deltaproteobacteria bacterium]|nr:lamin tail domain-containing protein [Deltaproteobacteria bacterium]